MRRRARRLGVAAALAGALGTAVVFAISGEAAPQGGTGRPPPEWARNAAAWPSHNAGLANTRANLATDIDARNVHELKKRWTFALRYNGPYGAFTSNPIVLGGVVYLENPDSTVFALRLTDGKTIWKHAYHSVTPSGGPNGVGYGYGLLFGETEGSVFALRPGSGKQVWIRKLAQKDDEGIDMAPQLYDGKVLISTIPGSPTSFYRRGAYGTVYALDARTGKVDWRFSTIKNPKRDSGGGLWYPPAVDSQGRVFIGVANPGPYPSTPSDPNGSSRPGPNLYTDSLVALDGSTGKLLWYRQVTPHDVRDYDFQDSPILATEKIRGARTEVVIGAGKSGKVIAFRARDGKRLWTLELGKHNRYQSGPLPRKAVVFCPGGLGGVLTPMAETHNVLYVPWIDLCFKGSATGLVNEGPVPPLGGGLAAVDPADGRVIWRHRLGSLDSGAATVAKDVVFTSTIDGRVYALSAKHGSTLWSTKAPAGINSFPAVTRKMLIVGAGAPTKAKHGRDELIAYSLP